MDFYVRLGFGCEFLRREREAGKTVGADFLSTIKKLEYKPVCDGFSSFCVVKILHTTKEDVLSKIKEAWEKKYPGNSDALSIFITPARDDEISNLMNVIYSNYFGVDDYIALVTEYTEIIPVLREKNALEVLRGQNILLSIDNGCGFTTFLASFSDYMTKLDVFPVKRSVYHEIKISAEGKGGTFTADEAYDYLFDEEKYGTTVGFDISYFLSDSRQEELREFLWRLDKIQDNYYFVFRVPFLEPSALEKVKKQLEDILPVRLMKVPPLSNAVLGDSLKAEMTKYGYKCGDDVAKAFEKRVTEEKKDGRFYGFKTAQKIAKEFIVKKAAFDAEALLKGEKPDKSQILASEIAADVSKTEKTGFEELSDLVGMEEIENKIREIVAQLKVSLENKSIERPCVHMRFTGAPGTGKTTVARIIGKIFREEGILRKGGFFEYTARSLCGEYVGQTAPKTAAICRDAYGSVLFIDEAYALYLGKGNSTNDYGKEAIATLIAEMENHRDDMLVIMAGYTDDMERLMEANMGLRSRMPFVIEFKSYTKEQLFSIFMQNVEKHFPFTEGLKNAAHDFFTSLSDAYVGSREFANARFARNLYERTWAKAALRASFEGTTSILITEEDFRAASSEKEFSESLIQENVIGFV